MTVEDFAPRRHGRMTDSGQFDSIFTLMGVALRTYIRHFPTFFTIYALAVLPASVITLVLKAENREGGWWMLLVTVLTGVVAFSAVAVATSDVSIGNRPSITRSYRRALGARGLAVLMNSAICCVIFASPLVFIYGVGTAVIAGATKVPGEDATMIALGALFVVAVPAVIVSVVLTILLMYVPIISALEMRTTIWRTIRRSISLGRHYRMRAVAIVAAGTIAFLLVAAAANIVTARLETNQDLSRETAALLVNLLVMPAAYIATILLYFDLRGRKDGYGFAELAEDIY